MASKGGKKKDGGGRSNSGAKDSAAPHSGADKKSGRHSTPPIWPEWNDADINSEKWEALKGGKVDKDKGKSPSLNFFDDPEGKLELPKSLKPRVSVWRRPMDIVGDRTASVVDDSSAVFDILTPNEHLHDSELMRWIISQITTLFSLNTKSSIGTDQLVTQSSDLGAWKPWENIYSLCKVGKGPHLPLYNSYGKYVVRLYWLGCWRKIVVDDSLPYDEQDNLLLPATTNVHELWPMLLSKAIIKVAALDFSGGSSHCEFGEVSVLHLLTSWLPEPVPLHYNMSEQIWDLLKSSLPEFKLPTAPEQPPPPDLGPKLDAPQSPKRVKKYDAKTSKDRLSFSSAQKDEPPEVLVYAGYHHEPTSPIRVSKLGEMADASETLRQFGLSHVYPHPLLLRKTRSCPLVAPPLPPIVPRWKLIRERKQKPPLRDEAPKPEVKPSEKYVYLTSPYLNYKVKPITVSSGTKKISSSLSKSGSRPSTAPLDVVTEDEDNISEDPNDKAMELVKAVDGEIIQESPRGDELKNNPPSATTKLGAEGKAKNQSANRKPPGEVKIVSDKKREISADKRADLKQSSGKSQTSGSVAKTEVTTPAANGTHTHNEAVSADDALVDSLKETVLEELPEANVASAVAPPNDPIWMHYDDLCKCFRTIYIFHKHSTYTFNHKVSDLKLASSAPTTGKKSGGLDKQSKGASPSATGSAYDDKSAQYLFADSLKPINIVVSFQVLSKWLDPLDDKSGKESVQSESPSQDTSTRPRLQPGTLMAEPYSWKSLVTGQPVLCISTTGVRSAMLMLPAGRHVLRFIANAPVGWHLHFCSTTQFVYGDEDSIMPLLVKESTRFVNHASQIIKSFKTALSCFNDTNAFTDAMAMLRKSYMPDLPEEKNTPKSVSVKNKQIATDVFNISLYKAIGPLTGESTPDLIFALRTLSMDFHSNISLLLSGKNSSASLGAASDTAIDISEPSDAEIAAANSIKALFKGHHVRRAKRARFNLHVDDSTRVRENLSKLHTVVEQNQDQLGIHILRTMLKSEPHLLERFSFSRDEWNKIAYSDYNGSYSDQPANHWFVVFRSLFYSEESVIVLPKVYCSIPTCQLAVIDNDTREEIPKIFQKVSPHIYLPNINGYTFVAYARTTEFPLLSGKWRMRLIGGFNPLPTPKHDTVNTDFTPRELKGYYIPNEKAVLFRYTIKSSNDVLASIQVNTSKPSAYIKLQVLKNEVEIVSRVGKGYVVLPSFIFDKDESLKRAQSSKSSLDKKSSRRGSSPAPIVSSQNYIIQALVLQNSWPLSASDWKHVETLKTQQMEDLKVFSGGRPPSSKQSVTPTASISSSVSTKPSPSKKGSRDKSKEKVSSKPSSARVDVDKAHFVMRFVCDAEDTSSVKVDVDTGRRDEIKAIKQAWELAEPGRAVKAAEARQKFLEDNFIPREVVEENIEIPPTAAESSESIPRSRSDVGAESDGDSPVVEPLTLEPPPKPLPAMVLKPVDETAFLTTCYSSPRVIDNDERERLMDERMADVMEWRLYRKELRQWRREQGHERNRLKYKQIEDCEKLQEFTDTNRQLVAEPREAVRQRMLEAERVRLEALQALENEMKDDGKGKKARGKSPKGGSGKGKKGSGKGKKK